MADTWNSCKIVMDPHAKNYINQDARGNFVLSKKSSFIPSLNLDMKPKSGDGKSSL